MSCAFPRCQVLVQELHINTPYFAVYFFPAQRLSRDSKTTPWEAMLCAVLLFQRQQWEQLCRGCPAEVRLQYKRAYKASICAVYSLSTTLISTKFINEIGHAPCSVLFCLFENQDIIPSHVLGYCAAPNFELVKHILHCSPRLELLPHSYPKST
jgi:hypothetical protein